MGDIWMRKRRTTHALPPAHAIIAARHHPLRCAPAARPRLCLPGLVWHAACLCWFACASRHSRQAVSGLSRGLIARVDGWRSIWECVASDVVLCGLSSELRVLVIEPVLQCNFLGILSATAWMRVEFGCFGLFISTSLETVAKILQQQGLLLERLEVTKKSRGQRRRKLFINYSGMDTEVQADSRYSGRVLGPAPDDSDWWDKKLLSGAVVVPEIGKPGYRMYYYGRGTEEWAKGVTPFNPSLPTGRNGIAVSEDGLQFERYRGHLSGGAIMDPSPEYDTFDAVHLGVSDVFYDQAEDMWRMYYFGGGYEESPLPTNPEKLFRGLKLRPGVATSKDGLAFEEREGPILELGEEGAWDCVGVSWPRVLRPEGNGDGKWLLTYHTRETGGRNNFGLFSAGVATSTDGKHWQKQGKVLSIGEPGTWDEGGVSVRHVLQVNGKYVMFYEGSDYKLQFAIGLATSDDGIVWEKDTSVGPEPGGPILKARVGENVWDNLIVGTPYVLAMDDGSFRMYYLGVGKLKGDGASKQGIGLAVSDGPNYRSWKRSNE